MKKLLLFLFICVSLMGVEKSPSDVYAEAVVLKKMLVELRLEHGIKSKFENVSIQKDKSPRHVLQKSIEVLIKVNKYREIHDFGDITIPPIPSRNITPQDVYNNVKRLKVEISYLLKDRRVLKNKRFDVKKYKDKTPSDVYKKLWEVSLAFDALLGQGFTPTDVYMQTQEILKEVQFLRSTQRINTPVEMPKKKANQHPNHALYKSIELLRQIRDSEKKLWMKPVSVPKVQQKVISPTEVYDSLQTITAELNRISRRIGVERSFKVKTPKNKKTSADVVQNLQYATLLMPTFSFNMNLNQYPKDTLVKTPSDVYALSEFILNKLQYIKVVKGIKSKIKETPYIYGLKPIHVYVKGLEDLEKISKLRKLEGFHPSQIPSSPDRKITPSEVYELILRLDDEINLLYKKDGVVKLESYRDVLEKRHYTSKTPSDVFNLLWKISYELDTILNLDYTPNETYILAQSIDKDVKNLMRYFLKKNIKLKLKTVNSKKPSDVFALTVRLLDNLQKVKNRGNMMSVKTIIPKDKVITPTSVYNALRIVSATISEIRVYYGIEKTDFQQEVVTNKTPSDVYSVVDNANNILELILEDKNYEN